MKALKLMEKSKKKFILYSLKELFVAKRIKTTHFHLSALLKRENGNCIIMLWDSVCLGELHLTENANSPENHKNAR